MQQCCKHLLININSELLSQDQKWDLVYDVLKFVLLEQVIEEVEGKYIILLRRLSRILGSFGLFIGAQLCGARIYRIFSGNDMNSIIGINLPGRINYPFSFRVHIAFITISRRVTCVLC